MEVPSQTSAEEHRKYFPGKMIHLGEGPAWRNILVEIHTRPPVGNAMLIPAVAEPQLIWHASFAKTGIWAANGTPISPSHFAHVFRKETGLSPHEYRERTMGNVSVEDFSRIATG